MSFFTAIAVGASRKEIMNDWEWTEQNLMETLGNLKCALTSNHVFTVKLQNFLRKKFLNVSLFQLRLKNRLKQPSF